MTGGIGDPALTAATRTLEAAAEITADGDSGLVAGLLLGPYRLLRPLGSGGMGAVWLAERADGLYAAQVAMKMLHPWLLQPSVRERFAREGRTLARLIHPNIARLLDAGIADHRLYLVLEYVRGERLDQWCDARTLGVEARIRLLLEVCAAVSAAHAALVVHRDLKPGNVLVSEGDGVKLLDFGIAKLIEADDTAARDLTELSRVSGSPFTLEYAAPEQIAEQPVTTATDVHALGVMLYVLLCGQRPFGAAGAGSAEVRRAIEHDEARPPSRVVSDAAAARRGSTTAALRKALSGDLDVIVAKALRKQPGERYGSVAEFAEDLRRHLELRPIRARPEARAYRFVKYLRRNRTLVAAGVVVATALAAGTSLALWQAAEARQQARRADAEARVAIEEQGRSQRVTEFLMSMFTQEDPLRRKQVGPVTLAQAFDDALARIDIELTDDPKLRADLLLDFGEVRANQGDLQAATVLFERARTLAEQSRPPATRQLVEALINLGVVAFYRSELPSARAMLERALAILDRQPSADPLQLHQARSTLANVLSREGETDRAIDLTRQLIEAGRGHSEVPPLDFAVSLSNLGVMLCSANRYSEAESVLDEAVTRFEQLHGAESANLNSALGCLSRTAEVLGDLPRAIRLAERADRINAKAFAGDHDFRMASLRRLGVLRVAAGQAEAGECLLRDALAMAGRLGVPVSESVEHDFAEALIGMDRPREALAVIADTSGPCATRSELAPDCLTLTSLAATAQLELGKPSEALRGIDAALVRNANVASPLIKADALTARAQALAALGRHAEALTDQRAAVQLTSKSALISSANDALFALIDRLADSAVDTAAAEAAQALAQIRAEPYDHRKAARLVATARTLRLQGRTKAADAELAAAIVLLERHQPSQARALRRVRQLLPTSD